MKILKLVFAGLLIFVTSLTVSAQSDKSERGYKSEKIKVEGLCTVDKNRIEKAALTVTGVKEAHWNVKSKLLTIKYDTYRKDIVDLVEQTIAAEGNDTESFKADDMVYNNLPKCCHYRKDKS